MKHKQFEKWILDDKPLGSQEKVMLETHLQNCRSCRSLRTGWQASKQLIHQASNHQPDPGFSARWNTTIIRKKQIEKIRRYRLSIFFLIILAFAGAVTYLVASGSVIQSLANSIAVLSDLVIKLTNGLSSLGYWFQTLPIAIPITIGFILFGFFSALMMAGIFFLWNLRRRELVSNEIKID